ncbi:hypothetical protein QR680_012569 [Steinernema hermaphroditum]|uniref:Integrin alpha-2 domain-containing protein n=1 Tax=Steinernema hermaphroditum TaxID=289476 RepID=A0AA39I407_9BILA|nr:hypothetical protein QR680_012569 [Steinernema hermaphroditum]
MVASGGGIGGDFAAFFFLEQPQQPPPLFFFLFFFSCSNKWRFAVGADDQTLVLNVSVSNAAEDAYQAQLTVAIPNGFEYGGIDSLHTKSPISCSADDSDDAYRFVCDVGNPLPAGETVHFGLKLTGTNVDPSAESFDVVMGASSQNPEPDATLSDNDVVLSIPIDVKAHVVLMGRSNPEQLDYSIRNRTFGVDATFDFEVGPLVTHLYQVINRGPSTISSTTLDIFWPSFAENGKHLLYLIDFPLVSSHGSSAECRIKQSRNVNPESLTISNEHISDEDFLRRIRRSADEDPKVREVKEDLREAVRVAKTSSGAAVEYRGGLSRISVNCNSLNCTHIECEIGELRQNEFVLVEVFSRLWVNTLIDDNIFEADISSLALAKISALPNVPHYVPTPQLIAVTTDVNPTDPELYRREVPWWLYALAILIGLVILALLVLCLWRCGFFKRNRPHAEKAKLDRSPGVREYYADASTRYAQSYLYSRDEHGERL